MNEKELAKILFQFKEYMFQLTLEPAILKVNNKDINKFIELNFPKAIIKEKCTEMFNHAKKSE